MPRSASVPSPVRHDRFDADRQDLAALDSRWLGRPPRAVVRALAAIGRMNGLLPALLEAFGNREIGKVTGQ